MHADMLVRINAIQTVGHQIARSIMQFCSQLHAGSTGPHNGHLQLLGAQWSGLCMGAQEGIHQSAVKAVGLSGVL